jgi:hypothetical protein
LENTPSLAKLRKDNKPTTILSIIKLLTDFRNRLNIDRNMSEIQIGMCAESIVDSNEFYMFRINDFAVCFNNAVCGHYGEFYNRLDEPMVFGFLRKYMIERDTAIARQRDNSQQNNIYELFQTEPMQKILTEVSDKLTHKEVEQMPKFERKPDAFQLFLSEWDKLPTKQFGGVNCKVYKAVEYVSVNDFMLTRMDEVRDELKKEHP